MGSTNDASRGWTSKGLSVTPTMIRSTCAALSIFSMQKEILVRIPSLESYIFEMESLSRGSHRPNISTVESWWDMRNPTHPRARFVRKLTIFWRT